jgi:hypothetical protein
LAFSHTKGVFDAVTVILVEEQLNKSSEAVKSRIDFFIFDFVSNLKGF